VPAVVAVAAVHVDGRAADRDHRQRHNRIHHARADLHRHHWRHRDVYRHADGGGANGSSGGSSSGDGGGGGNWMRTAVLVVATMVAVIQSCVAAGDQDVFWV